MARLLLVGVLLALLVAPLGHGGAVALGAGAGTTDGASVGPAAVSDMGVAQSQPFDRTVFSIEVYANGSARWTFSYRRALSNETQRQRFRAYAEEFNSQETSTYRDFRQRAEALTNAGANETGREMNATAFRKEAYVNNLGNQGIVEMSFIWTEFGATDSQRVAIGDVFEGGLYIGPNQRFVVTWSSALHPVTVTPTPTQRTGDALVWSGGQGGTQFLDSRPRVVFESAANGSGDSGAGGATDPSGSDVSGAESGDGTSGGFFDDVSGGDLPLWPLAVGIVVLVGSVGMAAKRGLLDPEGSDESGEGSRTGVSDGTPEGTAPDPTPTRDPEPAVSDEEFMTDEDRVLAMLADNGGRMKQVNIVEESDWSKSKVSMLLSEMEEAGQISKLRVGRENIISRPGDEPAASRSELDDDA